MRGPLGCTRACCAGCARSDTRPALCARRSWLHTNTLSGALIPSNVAGLGQLQELYVSNNELSVIPDAIGSLSSLVLLSANTNLFTTLPPALGSLTRLKLLDFYDCRLRGSIPQEIGSLTSLIGLRLNDNWLQGTIPSTLGACANLSKMSVHACASQALRAT